MVWKVKGHRFRRQQASSKGLVTTIQHSTISCSTYILIKFAVALQKKCNCMNAQCEKIISALSGEVVVSEVLALMLLRRLLRWPCIKNCTEDVISVMLFVFLVYVFFKSSQY